MTKKILPNLPERTYIDEHHRKKNVYWMYERLYEHSKRDLFSIWSLYEFHSFTLSLELTQLMIFGVFGRFTAVTLHSNSFAVFFFICNFNIPQKLARGRYKYLYRIFSWASSLSCVLKTTIQSTLFYFCRKVARQLFCHYEYGKYSELINRSNEIW